MTNSDNRVDSGGTMSEFTIGKPMTVPRSIGPNGKGKYVELWEQAKDLRDGMSLPVTFADELCAKRFQAGNNAGLKRRGLRCQLRGNVAYVSKREQPT